jgi:hypothetical protein
MRDLIHCVLPVFQQIEKIDIVKMGWEFAFLGHQFSQKLHLDCHPMKKYSSISPLSILGLGCLLLAMTLGCTPETRKEEDRSKPKEEGRRERDRTLTDGDTIYYSLNYDTTYTANEPEFDRPTVRYNYDVSFATMPHPSGDGKPVPQVADSIKYYLHLPLLHTVNDCKIVQYVPNIQAPCGNGQCGFVISARKRLEHLLEESIDFPFKASVSDDVASDRIGTGGGLIVILEPIIEDPQLPPLLLDSVIAYKGGEIVPTKAE